MNKIGKAPDTLSVRVWSEKDEVPWEDVTRSH